MINRKRGANRVEQNFIKRCVTDEVTWDIPRIAAHLLIEENVVQNFYDGFVKELENSDSEPDDSQEEEEEEEEEEEIAAEEEFG